MSRGRVSLQELVDALPQGRVLTDPDATDRYLRDEAEWAAAGAPLAVVRARSTAEVQTTVRWCLTHAVPLVPRGAGTGLSGGANAVDGCVVLSLEAMDSVLEVNAAEHLAVVQPGVINDSCGRCVPSTACGTRPTRRAPHGRRSGAT